MKNDIKIPRISDNYREVHKLYFFVHFKKTMKALYTLLFFVLVCWKGSLFDKRRPSKDENVVQEEFKRAHHGRNDKYGGPEI